jgi:hypothetical protein
MKRSKVDEFYGPAATLCSLWEAHDSRKTPVGILITKKDDLDALVGFVPYRENPGPGDDRQRQDACDMALRIIRDVDRELPSSSDAVDLTGAGVVKPVPDEIYMLWCRQLDEPHPNLPLLRPQPLCRFRLSAMLRRFIDQEFNEAERRDVREVRLGLVRQSPEGEQVVDRTVEVWRACSSSTRLYWCGTGFGGRRGRPGKGPAAHEVG